MLFQHRVAFIHRFYDRYRGGRSVLVWTCDIYENRYSILFTKTLGNVTFWMLINYPFISRILVVSHSHEKKTTQNVQIYNLKKNTNDGVQTNFCNLIFKFVYVLSLPKSITLICMYSFFLLHHKSILFPAHNFKKIYSNQFNVKLWRCVKNCYFYLSKY